MAHQYVFHDGESRISTWFLGTGTRNSHARTPQNVDSETNIQSGLITKMEQRVAQWKVILFQLDYLQTMSFCFYISNCTWNYKPSGVFSLNDKLWENRDLTTAASNYLYLCGRIYASRLYYISNRPYWIGQKLKWNVTQALRKTIYHWQFIIYWQLVYSPF
jgi:hypothetical protein